MPSPPPSPYEGTELSVITSQPTNRGAPDQLDKLLSSGADPNYQPTKASKLLSEIEPDWASQDPPPQFELHGEQWLPPLYSAAYARNASQQSKDENFRMVTSLLQHGADPFLEFPQALYHPPRDTRPRAPFPGEDPPRRAIPDVPSEVEWHDLGDKIVHNSEDDMEDEETPPRWGVRHILHAIIEDSGRFKPFMDYPGFLESLNIEHRDPQGRTPLLSACRSALGADARAGAGLGDLSWNSNVGGFDSNPYPKWDRDSGPTEWDYPDPRTETLVDVFLRLGADPLAVDHQGKNALHHLLVEVRNNQNARFHSLTVVRRTLRILSSKYPSLVSQPDQHGIYPLHAALRRMRLHPKRNVNIDMAELQGCLLELLHAGADPRAKDRKGNTALHYLADDDLTGIWFCTERRQIFYQLLDKYRCREDINLPNKAGKTVAELILDDNGRMEADKDRWYGFMRRPEEGRDLRQWKDVDEEVFSKLDDAGIDWKVKTSDGGTLLHLVARSGLEGERLIWRTHFLLRKGVELKATDGERRTAREVAVEGELNKRYFYHALDELERGEAEA